MEKKKISENKTNKQDLIIKKICNPSLKEVLIFLSSKKILNINKINCIGDIEINVKQEIEDSIKKRYQEIHEKFSELRKNGKDLGVLNFKLMMIPHKINILLATYEKKDAENLIKRIEEVEKGICLK